MKGLPDPGKTADEAEWGWGAVKTEAPAVKQWPCEMQIAIGAGKQKQGTFLLSLSNKSQTVDYSRTGGHPACSTPHKDGSPQGLVALLHTP